MMPIPGKTGKTKTGQKPKAYDHKGDKGLDA
jgi:hypothetical protein